ncbi:substrate-binding domain-containing protein [Aquisalimonas lutea]|uniref:substrate-binding domain-containing protein n=1 Tax=Aquisalimonas lutea TaxID=1327750 RepID=UPI0025B4B2D7|nr:substrate-binding domain-containing protein [Aquisalimonas lutea]MDN3517085.1 substrate-binding domain-containing protein [Aquisalimonas lutea]
MNRLLTTAAVAASVLTAGAAGAQEAVRIAHISGFSGPLEAYAEQTSRGMEMGFEYATDGSMEVAGRPIEIIRKDDQGDPSRARALAQEAYGEDDAHMVVGSISSGVALAMLPIAQEWERIMIPEGVADGITGEQWNRYIFRIGRNSSQDAVSNAVAIGEEGVCVATIAQDYAFGRDGVAAYKEAMEAEGGRVVHEEYLPTDATDFTAAAQRLFESLRGRDDCTDKYIFGIWAGQTNPFGRIQDLEPERYGITMSTGGNILPAMVGYSEFEGMEGATFYYFESPDNDMNDWLVEQHYDRYDAAPDFFTAQGFAQAIAITEALRETDGSTDTEDLIAALEGLEFDTPKGPMRIRPEDHQAMQSMYHFRIEAQERSDWFAGDETQTVGVPVLVDELTKEELDIPIRN